MKALVVGGSNGIGLSIVLNLLDQDKYSEIYVLDKSPFPSAYTNEKIHYISINLLNDWNLKDKEIDVENINALYITAGFGQLEYFQNLSAEYIQSSFSVNTISPILILKQFYHQLLGEKPFYCAVMVSIAGRLNSPLFSIYSATKAALSKCIEALNTELEVQGSNNRILEVSPGSLKGTSFTGGITDPKENLEFAKKIIRLANNHETLFIPQYNEVFKQVIERYHADVHAFGVESYYYKKARKNQE